MIKEKSATTKKKQPAISYEKPLWKALLILAACRCIIDDPAKPEIDNRFFEKDRVLRAAVRHISAELNLKKTPSIADIFGISLQMGFFS